MSAASRALEVGGRRWTLAAHVRLSPPPADWRDALAVQLGHRPRRLGEWTELAMHGALLCLREAGETQLPAQARLRLASCGGPSQALGDAMGQMRDGLPMPFAFMQAQPAITLAVLGRALRWQGDAAFATVREMQGLLDMSLRGASSEGVLIGRVEHGPQGLMSEWWRWRR